MVKWVTGPHHKLPFTQKNYASHSLHHKCPKSTVCLRGTHIGGNLYHDSPFPGDSPQTLSQIHLSIRESHGTGSMTFATEAATSPNFSIASSKIPGGQLTLTWSWLGRAHRGVVVFGGWSDWCVLFGGGIDSWDRFSFTVCYGDWSLLSQDVGQSPKGGGDHMVRFLSRGTWPQRPSDAWSHGTQSPATASSGLVSGGTQGRDGHAWGYRH